jgi:hypothetical protein
MKKNFLIALLLPCALTVAVPAFADCSASSGPGRTALLELYTSEGCSSCPPADRWLSRLNAEGVDRGRVVPLALHVDYWDYIGWRDRYAQPAFTARQRNAAQLGHSNLVYTPQVLLNGRDFRNWNRQDSFGRELAAINNTPPQASIQISLKPRPDAFDLAANIRVSQEGSHAFYVAVYENGLTTGVERGENAGSKLRHDFVVREWLGPFASSGKAAISWQQPVKLEKEWKTKQLGVAAFVQNTATGEVLQAVSLPFCGE